MLKDVEPNYMTLLDSGTLGTDEDFSLTFIEGIEQTLSEFKLTVDAAVTKVCLPCFLLYYQYPVFILKCVQNFVLTII